MPAKTLDLPGIDRHDQRPTAPSMRPAATSPGSVSTAEAQIDRIAVLSAGEIKAMATPSELTARSGAADLTEAYVVLTGTRPRATDRPFPSLRLIGGDGGGFLTEGQHSGFELENPLAHGR